MARPTPITTLPADVRATLDALLLDKNFSDYSAITEYFREHGYNLSKSSINRYGQKLERKLLAIKDSTEFALALEKNAPDNTNALGGGLVSLNQVGMFNAIIAFQEAEEEQDPIKRIEAYSKSARAAADLSRASIATKKWRAEVNAKAQAVADKAAKLMTKGGLSTDTIDTIRREILGIPS